MSFATLEELLNTTDGMTVLRNNSANDDSVDTVAGVDWFTFNNVVASNLYVSGNSFIGFGSNSEHLKVCRRDAKVYYLYRQEGAIGATKFLKIRWEGYAQYNQTGSSYALKWEAFLFDDGGIYLNLFQVPSVSGYLGTNALVCGSNTYTFTVTLSTPVAYSFLPQEDGTYVVSADIYPVVTARVPFGSAEFSTTVIQKVSNVKESSIWWDADVPENTTLKIFTKLSNGIYVQCENGGKIEGIESNADLSAETLYIKVEMTTSDLFETPILSNLRLIVYDQSDTTRIVLVFPSGTPNSFQRAVGDIKIAYDGSGTLMGQGGPVLAFEQTFTPVNLDPKNNPNDVEHIELSDIQASATLTRIYYTDSSETEHIKIGSISAVGILTHINDI